MNTEHIISSLGLEMVDLTDRSYDSEERGGGPGAL
jgi:hypothetical protein